jgi:hypothetical protein
MKSQCCDAEVKEVNEGGDFENVPDSCKRLCLCDSCKAEHRKAWLEDTARIDSEAGF